MPRLKEYIRYGEYPGKYGKLQKYRCRICGRQFRDNLGMEYRQVPHAHISLTLSGSGLSAASIQLTLNDLGTKVHVDTITRILKHYVELTESYTDTLKPPCTGDKWGCDEKQQNVRGVSSYIMAVMDYVTRFVLSWDTSPTKQNYDCIPLLHAAENMAGKIPRLFITDGLSYRLQEGVQYVKGDKVHPHT